MQKWCSGYRFGKVFRTRLPKQILFRRLIREPFPKHLLFRRLCRKPFPKYLHCGFNTWFLGRPDIVDFGGLGGPSGPKNPSKGGRIWNGFWGRRGRPNHKNQRLPASPKTIYQKPNRARVLNDTEAEDQNYSYLGRVGPLPGQTWHPRPAPTRQARKISGQTSTPTLGLWPQPYDFIGFGDIHGPKPYEFIGFGDIHGPNPMLL